MSTGSLGLDIALGTGGLPRGRDRRGLRAGVVGQDDAGAARRRARRSARAACARSSTPSTRWTSATRASSASRRRTCWCRSRTAASRRWRSPTCWCGRRRSTSIVIDSVAALVPRAELEGEMGDSHVGLQARLMSQALRKLTGAIARGNTPGHLHQPAAHEDRRDVRQPGDDDGRQRAEVLRVGAAGHPAHRRAQGRRAGGRQPHAREGGEEQDGGAVPRDRVRRRATARGSRGRARSSTSASRRACSRRAAPGSATAASASATGARRPRQHLLEHQDLLKEIRGKLLAHAGIGATPGATPAAASPAPPQPANDVAKPAVKKVA